MTAKRRSTLLNSLSRILELEFGAASLQNYGLFDADIGGLGCPAPVIKGAKSEALEVDKLLHGQQLFQQLLFDLVSAKIDKNSSILLAGESLLPLATKLTGAGFFIQWVGPRKSLGELAGR